MAKVVLCGFEGWDCCGYSSRWKVGGWKIRGTLWAGCFVYICFVLSFLIVRGIKIGFWVWHVWPFFKILGRLRSWTLLVMRLFWCHQVLLASVAKGLDTEN